jgi:antitoxin MazE
MADLRVTTRLIRIGNSRGVRLAKPLLEQAGLEDEVEIRVGPNRLLDAPTGTRFDDTEWTW